MEPPPSESRLIPALSRLPSPRALIFFLVLLTVLTYFNTLFYGFVWDDKWLIPNSSLIRQWSTLPTLLTSDFWTEDSDNSVSYYRPVVSLSYFLEYRLWGLNPAGYHLTNLLLHLAVTLLLFWVCQLLFRDFPLSFFAGIIFALHPIHTESVTFISGRTDLFATLFFLLGFGLYVRTREQGRLGWLYAGALLAFGLALLSKEVAATFPLVLILHELLLRERSVPPLRVILRHLPFWGVLAGYLLLRAMILGTLLSKSVQLDSLDARLLTGMKGLAAYLRLMVAPYPLNAQHMFFVTTTWREPAFLASLALVVLAFALTLLASRWSKRVSFAGLWFFVTLLPTSNLLVMSGTMMAERFLYLPSVGFSLLAATGLTKLLTSRRALASSGVRQLAGIAICLILVSYMGLAMLRNEDWKDEYRLFSKTAEDSPLSTLAKVNLGYVHIGRGEYPLAVRQFHEALRLMPDAPRALIGLGVAYSMLGRHDAAVAYGERALAREPKSPVIHGNLGTIYFNAGALEPAITYYREMLRQKPQNSPGRYNLAVALARLGRHGEAVAELETADRLAKLYLPDDSTRHRSRALVYENSDPELAILSWERYLSGLSAIANPTQFQTHEAQSAKARLEWLKKSAPPQQG